MPASDVRQRQKSSLKQQNGEKRRSEDEEEEKRTTTKKESVAREALTVDVRLCVSALCLALSVLIAWLHVQQSHTLAELRGQYESLREKSRRGAEQLDEKISRVSEQLQASADAAALLWSLRLSVGSVLNSSVALQEGLEASSRRLQVLLPQSPSGPAQLQALQAQARGAHTLVTEQVNAAEGRLRALEERLEEVRAGSGRNTRALDRSEEEDVRRLRELMDWDAGRLSRLEEELERLGALGVGLRERLEGRGPRDPDAQLAAAEEAVRSMLRVRAHLSNTLARVQELERQVRSAEDQRRTSRSPTPDLRGLTSP